MQNPVFLLLVFTGLLARWLLLPEARAVKPARALLLGALLAAPCWLAFEQPLVASISLAIYGIAVALILLWRERNGVEAPGTRLLLLVAHILLVAVLCDQFLPSASIERHAYRPFPTGIVWLTGALLCLKESNFFIRWFFARMKTSTRGPQVNEEQKVRAENGNGRVIGSLERLLIYVLLLGGHTFAVPAVIAVKALARFKRMEEDQAFAEYVIIGTFLSILLTLAALGCANALGVR